MIGLRHFGKLCAIHFWVYSETKCDILWCRMIHVTICRLITRHCYGISRNVLHKKKLLGMNWHGPGANYTDRVTAACWRSYYFFQVAPQLYSRG
jgi:hypothetical protein